MKKIELNIITKKRGGSGTHWDYRKKWNKKSDAKCILQPNQKDIEVRMPRNSNTVFSHVFHCVCDCVSASIPSAISKQSHYLLFPEITALTGPGHHKFNGCEQQPLHIQMIAAARRREPDVAAELAAELDAPGNDCCAIQMGPQPISLIVCTMPLTVDGVETTPILDASSGMLVFAMCSSASESRFAQDRQIGGLLHRQHTEASEPLAVLTMDFEPQARHLSMQHHCGLCSFYSPGSSAPGPVTVPHLAHTHASISHLGKPCI